MIGFAEDLEDYGPLGSVLPSRRPLIMHLLVTTSGPFDGRNRLARTRGNVFGPRTFITMPAPRGSAVNKNKLQNFKKYKTNGWF